MDDPRSTTPSDSVATTNGLLPSLILAVASVVGLLAISILPASIPIFVPDLIERYGAQLEDLGALFIGGSIIAVFLVMPIAFLADRFGYPYSLLAVFAVAAICMLNAAISTSLDSAITAHVIASIMSAAAIPITVVLVYRTASANWRSTSIALVLIAPMAAGPIVAALSSYEATRVGILIGTATVIAACAIAIAVNSEASARPVRRFRPHIFDGRVVWWIAAAALCASVVGAIPASGPSLMLSIGERLQEIIRSGTHVLTYPTLGVLSGMLLGGMSADLLGRRSGRPDIRVGIGGAILAAVAAIATTAFDEPGGFLLAVAFVGFGVGAVLPVAHSSVQHLAGRQFAAAAAATISTAATFGATVGAGTLSSLFASLSRTRAQTEALDLSFLWLAVVELQQ